MSRILVVEDDIDIADLIARYLTNAGHQVQRLTSGADVVPRLRREGVDLIILDAFNSDSIPAHLLSLEAIHNYTKKLKPDGAILFHVSTPYFRARELVAALAAEAKLPALSRTDQDASAPGKARSIYVIVALDEGTIRELKENADWVRATPDPSVRPWTDDYSNLWAILKWR